MHTFCLYTSIHHYSLKRTIKVKHLLKLLKVSKSSGEVEFTNYTVNTKLQCKLQRTEGCFVKSRELKPSFQRAQFILSGKKKKFSPVALYFLTYTVPLPMTWWSDLEGHRGREERLSEILLLTLTLTPSESNQDVLKKRQGGHLTVIIEQCI